MLIIGKESFEIKFMEKEMIYFRKLCDAQSYLVSHVEKTINEFLNEDQIISLHSSDLIVEVFDGWGKTEFFCFHQNSSYEELIAATKIEPWWLN